MTQSPPRLIASPADLNALSPAEVEARYRPFLLTELQKQESNWVDELELETVAAMAGASESKIKLVVLYGSLRERSFSRLTAYEASRILHRLGADVRVFDPRGLPVKDDTSEKDVKVQELRALSEWSDGQFWCSPEQHGTITAVFKNQIDWIPLSVGSVRPTQGRTLAVSQINGGSQSFNTVNLLRQLGRWMRMWTIPNQSSIPLAWKSFTPTTDRLLPSSNRDRLVDVCEELIKTTLLLLPHRGLLDDRFSEREERRAHGRLRTQAETEAAKALTEEAKRAVEKAASNGGETA
ncbi:flavo protein-like protein [Leucosporidium creatinivorum]|uniref:Flavo protein-like protein n=1 Tax=Leucosporidium creatinivorum TaxID=106004 RepID=A0A1Y2D9M1_9BASI|nr:flavo protein-like protein [Leucosporidium creatinivorum]